MLRSSWLPLVRCRPLMPLRLKNPALGHTASGSSSHPSLPGAHLSPGASALQWRICPPSPRWSHSPLTSFFRRLTLLNHPWPPPRPISRSHPNTELQLLICFCQGLLAFQFPSPPFCPVGLFISLTPLEPSRPEVYLPWAGGQERPQIKKELVSSTLRKERKFQGKGTFQKPKRIYCGWDLGGRREYICYGVFGCYNRKPQLN